MLRLLLLLFVTLSPTISFAQEAQASSEPFTQSYSATSLQGFKIDTLQILKQRAIRGSRIDKTPEELTLTITVVNSDKLFHVATLRYYDTNGDPILNTIEEFRIDVSGAKRFATGSVRKTVPIYLNTASVKVEVSGCVNMHENEFLIEEAEVANYEVAFLFRAEVEDMVAINFEGIQENKPGTFTIRGFNTTIIYYADYNDATKYLPDEADVEDIKVELSPTSLHNYGVANMEIDKDRHRIQVIVQYSEKPIRFEEEEEQSNNEQLIDESTIDNRKKKRRRN